MGYHPTPSSRARPTGSKPRDLCRVRGAFTAEIPGPHLPAKAGIRDARDDVPNNINLSEYLGDFFVSALRSTLVVQA